MSDAYALWRSELKAPTPEADRERRPADPALMNGFWRITAARTKVSYPCAIFPQDGPEGRLILFKVGVGSRDGESLFSDAMTERLSDFMSSTWLRCVAVTEAEYHAAMESGRWSDGAPARKFSDLEKLDIIPDTATAEGGNNPVDEDGNPIDLFHEQVVTKIAAQLDKVKTLKWPFKSINDANAAAEIVETLRGLGTQGEARRKEEKKPFKDAADAVDAKWAVVRDASEQIKALVTAIDSFKTAEEARLRRERDEAERLERERIRREAEERVRKEAEEAARQATARGEAFEEPTEEAIAEQAAAEAEEAIAAAPPMPEPTVRVGTAHGRAISKPKRKTGKITDRAAFIAALDKQSDFNEWLQEKADRLARADTALAGMEIELK